MPNPKIPQGYQGTYGHTADGSATLIMVSRSESIVDGKTIKKEQSMSEQTNGTFVPYTTEQKREYAKQFTAADIKSYRQGQRSAYAHMGNIGKRNSFFIHDNLKKNEATPPASPAPAEAKPKNTRRNNNTGNK